MDISARVFFSSVELFHCIWNLEDLFYITNSASKENFNVLLKELEFSELGGFVCFEIRFEAKRSRIDTRGKTMLDKFVTRGLKEGEEEGREVQEKLELNVR